MSNEKSSRKSPKDSAPSQDSPAPSSAGALASKIAQISIRDLKKGDRVLYPGNKVIPVASVEDYRLHDAPFDPVPSLYVVKFEGQPAQCYLAFEPDEMIYIYKP